MERIKLLEERLSELWDMHEQMATRFRALAAVSRVMLPLVPAAHATLLRLAASSYDNENALMQAQDVDPYAQTKVREAMDQIWTEILQVAEKRSRPPVGDD